MTDGLNDPRKPYVRGDNGCYYSTARPDDIQEAKDLARTTPWQCGDLYDAVSDNNLEKVREILCLEDNSKEKIEWRNWYVNEKSWHDWRALHAAAEAGYLEMAKILLDCGAEINLLTTDNNTVVQLAAAGGHVELLKFLLDKGGAVDIPTESGLCGTALHYAAGKGHLECVRVLTDIPSCEDLVNEFSAEYCTALYYAVIGLHVEIVKRLIEKGGKKTINATDWDDSTALHIAAQIAGSLDLVKLLVEDGEAYVYLKNREGLTPAGIAKKFANVEVYDYLDGKMLENIENVNQFYERI